MSSAQISVAPLAVRIIHFELLKFLRATATWPTPHVDRKTWRARKLAERTMKQLMEIYGPDIARTTPKEYFVN